MRDFQRTDEDTQSGLFLAYCRHNGLPLALLLLLVMVVLGRILANGFIFNWDDAQYVTENDAIRSVSIAHLQEIFTRNYVGNYAPVQMLSYMLDYWFWGLNPAGYLFTNLLVHATNGLLFYMLMLNRYGKRLIATVAAAFFLLHPVQVESVAWISQRKNLLAMLFFLLAWECYRRFREGNDGSRWRSYVVSLVCFVLALLAKSVVVILPLVLILDDICFSIGGWQRRLKDKVPYLVLAGVVAVLAIYMQRTEFGGGRADFHGGGPVATLLTMVTVICRYLGMLIWPRGLSAIYAPTIHGAVDGIVVSAVALLVCIVCLGWVLFRRDRRLAFWLLLFFVGLIPVSQIVPLVTLMNDRYLYFPLLGVAALFGVGASYVRQRLGVWASVLFFAVPISLFAICSFQRAAVWHNPLQLWSDAVAKEPLASYAWSSLAEVHFRELRVQEALAAYEKSLTLDPKNRMAIAALGPIYTEMGDVDRGYRMLKKYVELRPEDVKGWAYLGNNFLLRGDFVEAEKMYRKALTIKPDSRRVIFLLGNFLLERQRFTEAFENFMQAEVRWPNDPYIAYQLAGVAARAGKPSEALVWLESALKRGYRDYSQLAEDHDLSRLWNDPRFNMLLQRYFPEQTQSP